MRYFSSKNCYIVIHKEVLENYNLHNLLTRRTFEFTEASNCTFCNCSKVSYKLKCKYRNCHTVLHPSCAINQNQSYFRSQKWRFLCKTHVKAKKQKTIQVGKNLKHKSLVRLVKKEQQSFSNTATVTDVSYCDAKDEPKVDQDIMIKKRLVKCQEKLANMGQMRKWTTKSAKKG